MNAQTTATTVAAEYAKKAADAAATAIACYQAAADLAHDFTTNDEKVNARFAFKLKGHHAVRDAKEAVAYANGQAARRTATAATIAYANAARDALAEAEQMQTDIQHMDHTASVEWRREQRLRNEDGSFALTDAEKEEAASRGY